ncbi:MATE family efflux transporter [Panacagrimonas sp.]|uniref:MATE family efflux transporter n=1 Tax=Panacagrimonas sp. TaxID=2480088 RepID=UPI003B526965
MALPLMSVLRGEARANLKLALPLIAAQITFVSMGTVDTIFAGQLGASELAAVAVGSNVWFLVFVMFMGIAMAVSPIVAQRVGAGQLPERIGAFVRGSLGVALVLGAIWFALMWVATPLALWLLELDAKTHTYARDYLHALAWGALPFTLSFFLRNGAEGHGLTRVPLAAGLVGLTVNAVFDWLLMYGRWGFPELGPEGCGWASVIAAWAMVGVYLTAYRRVPTLRALNLFRRGWLRFAREDFEVLRVGLPVAAILMAEAWLFCSGTLMMARFGADTVAAHQIAINFASLCFMVPTAIGMATTVRVGHAAGAGQHAVIGMRSLTGVLLGVTFACLSASFMALAPGAIVGVYTDLTHLAIPAMHFLIFAAVFQVFDCIQATANGALRGVKDTRVPMMITVLAYWGVGMPLAVGLAFFSEVGPDGVWWGFIGGLVVAAVGLSLRLVVRARRVAAAAA